MNSSTPPSGLDALMLMAILNQGGSGRQFHAPGPMRKIRARTNNPAKCICGGNTKGFCKRHRVYVDETGKDR